MKTYISIIENSSYIAIDIHTPITMDTGSHIEEEIVKSLETARSNIAIDLKNSQVIFSAGMGLLARINTLTQNKNKHLFLINPTKKVFQALESLGITTLIKTFQSEDLLIEYLEK